MTCACGRRHLFMGGLAAAFASGARADEKSATAISGVVWQSRGPFVIVRQASLLKAREAPTPIDGEIVIERDHVSYVQVLP